MWRAGSPQEPRGLGAARAKNQGHIPEMLKSRQGGSQDFQVSDVGSYNSIWAHIKTGRNHVVPQTVLALRGSDGFSRDQGGRSRVILRSSLTQFDEEKCILGDTCSRLVYTKQGVASSNIDIYNIKSTFSAPVRPSARPPVRPSVRPSARPRNTVWGLALGL